MGKNKVVVEPQEEVEVYKRVVLTTRHNTLTKALDSLKIDYEIWAVKDGQKQLHIVEFYTDDVHYDLLLAANTVVISATAEEITANA